MQQGYFSRSWEAFRSTEGWFAKICILALIAFIPILGPIVVSGYLLGWARDAAWGMDRGRIVWQGPSDELKDSDAWARLSAEGGLR